MPSEQSSNQTMMIPAEKAAPRARLPRVLSDSGNKVIVMLIAAVTVFAACVTFLQINASAQSDRYNREIQVGSVLALQSGIQGQLDYAHELDLFRTYRELSALSDLALLQSEAAASGRFLAAADALKLQSQMLPSPDYFDESTGSAYTLNYYVDKVYIPTLRAVETQTASQLTGQAWSQKGNAYQVVITLTAVTLFLYGLALTLEGCLKWGFVGLGTANTLIVLLWVIVTMLRPIPRIDPATIEAYVTGNSYVWYGFQSEYQSDYENTRLWADAAIAELDQAIDEERNYANAYGSRADAYLLYGESLFLSAGDATERDQSLTQAAADYRRAIDLKPDDFHNYWNLGWVLYMLEDYEAALETFDTVQELVPRQQFGVSLNRASILLGMNQTDAGLAEFRRAIEYAATSPLSSDVIYFRQTIRNIEQLQQLRPHPAMPQVEKMLKEALVSLQYRQAAGVSATNAQITALTFAVPVPGTDGIRYREGTIFPAETEQVIALFDYEGIANGQHVVLKVYHQGIERPWLNQIIEQWPHPESGRSDHFAIQQGLEATLTYLTPGSYHVELYVEGNLTAEGDFTVQ
jgi:tetratricopeptide (TPR) repeat protein